jgi:hypothetical protein
LLSAEKVSAYAQGLDHQEFVGNSLVYDATLRNLELIGEAATHIPDDVRSVNPHGGKGSDPFAARNGNPGPYVLPVDDLAYAV